MKLGNDNDVNPLLNLPAIDIAMSGLQRVKEWELESGSVDPAASNADEPIRETPRGIIAGYIKTCNRWRLNSEQQKLLLGCSETDSVFEDIISGSHQDFPNDVAKRIGCVIAISLGLRTLFSSNDDAEYAWMNLKRGFLNDLTPIQFMLRGSLAEIRAVEGMVGRERGL